MRFASYTFVFSTPKDYVPENPLGLRDELMKSLRIAACVCPEGDCKSCKEGYACSSFRIFMSPIDWKIAKSFFFKKVSQGFSFELRLFSYAADEAACHIARLLEKLKPCRLESLEGLGGPVALLGNGFLFGLTTVAIDFPLWNPHDRWDGTLKLSFLTPCRIRRRNENPRQQLSFTEFLELVIACINYLWGVKERHFSLLDLEAFSRVTRLIEVKEDHLYWLEEGLASESGEKIFAVSGDISYKGELSSFLPFLSLASKVQGRRIEGVDLGEFSYSMEYSVKRRFKERSLWF